MNKHFYLQHEIMSINDPRIQAMIEQEGSKAYGTYWYIMEKLSLLPDCRADLQYLKPFACRKFTFTYMMRIVREFDLFTLREDFFIPVQLNTCPVECRKKSRKKDEKCPMNEAKSSENDGFSTKKGARVDENANSCMPETDCNVQVASVLSKSSKRQKENKRVKTTATEKEEEKTAAVVDAEHCPLQPVRSWQELVDGLSLDCEWAEMACMKSGYGILLAKHFPAAVQLFKRHILLYDKGGSLLSKSDVHQYFANFTAPGSRTSRALREELLKLDTAERTDPSDPYRYEQRLDGRRTYLGCLIPDNAPPRPNDAAIWNILTEEWIIPQKFRPSAV